MLQVADIWKRTRRNVLSRHQRGGEVIKLKVALSWSNKQYCQLEAEKSYLNNITSKDKQWVCSEDKPETLKVCKGDLPIHNFGVLFSNSKSSRVGLNLPKTYCQDQKKNVWTISFLIHVVLLLFTGFNII